tara:strand:- start:2873 stop:4141 length:1269 start_codon:yes stop_codon:yes gene_type:complete
MKIILWVIFFMVFGLNSQIYSQAIKVEVSKEGNSWKLLRDGKPYYINGAGGQTNLDLLIQCGGNSFRTWSYEGAQKLLDDAQSKGLTVTLGLWLGHERHGFDYNDKWAVKGQMENFRNVVKKYKDHPALLMWGVGNEMDLFYSNFKVWNAVEDISKMIHELDPNHPTMVVTAGLDVAEVQLIQKMAPSIDILGVNTYGDIVNVPENIELYQWNKPYVVTEWGPNGHWEVENTEWKVSIEQTAHEKAEAYSNRFNIIKNDVNNCFGSYVFLWGQKQEYTNTWYGLFNEKNMPTEAIDNICKAWSGEWPKNRAPQLIDFKLDGKNGYDNIYLESGKSYSAKAIVKDEKESDLEYIWELVPESTDKKAGGDVEEKPEALKGYISKTEKLGEIEMKAPQMPGAYRLFIYASDGSAVTYANWPFYVK